MSDNIVDRPAFPQTPGEWREAVAAAHVWLLVDSAKLYGLVEGGPTINRERCEFILAEGQRRGFKPDQTIVQQMLGQLSGRDR